MLAPRSGGDVGFRAHVLVERQGFVLLERRARRPPPQKRRPPPRAAPGDVRGSTSTSIPGRVSRSRERRRHARGRRRRPEYLPPRPRRRRQPPPRGFLRAAIEVPPVLPRADVGARRRACAWRRGRTPSRTPMDATSPTRPASRGAAARRRARRGACSTHAAPQQRRSRAGVERRAAEDGGQTPSETPKSTSRAANLVAGRVRRVVDARALLDQLLVRALPGFLGAEAARRASPRSARRGAPRDAHRRLSGLSRSAPSRRRRPSRRLSSPSPASPPSWRRRCWRRRRTPGAQARCPRIRLRAGVRRPSERLFSSNCRRESRDPPSERLGDGAPAPGQVRGGGARRVAHDGPPSPSGLFPHLHELGLGGATAGTSRGPPRAAGTKRSRGGTSLLLRLCVSRRALPAGCREGLAGTFPGNLFWWRPELGDGDGAATFSSAARASRRRPRGPSKSPRGTR